MCDRFNNVGLENYPVVYGEDPEYTKEVYGTAYYKKLYNDVWLLYNEKAKKINKLYNTSYTINIQDDR